MGEIFGRNPVLEALKAGTTINKLIVAKGEQKGSIQEILRLAKEQRVQVQLVERNKLDKMFAGQNHQGVAAQIATADYVDWQDMLQAAKDKGEDVLLVILDELEDPHNLGAILRSVDAVGAHGVIIPKRRSAGLTAIVAKTSAGAVSYVPVARVPNLTALLKELKEAGIWIFGTAADGNTTLYDADLKGPAAIVIGSEGNGMGRLVSEQCDFKVSIPMKGKLNSLNASAAAAILLYEAVRQRLG